MFDLAILSSVDVLCTRQYGVLLLPSDKPWVLADLGLRPGKATHPLAFSRWEGTSTSSVLGWKAMDLCVRSSQQLALCSLSASEVLAGVQMVERCLKRGLIRCRWKGNKPTGLPKKPCPLPGPFSEVPILELKNKEGQQAEP